MTPIQKAKEIIELYVFNMPDGLTQGEHEVSIYHFLQTPAAAALLPGEDDGQEGKGLRWVKASERLPEYSGEYTFRLIGSPGEAPVFFNKKKEEEFKYYNKVDEMEWLDETPALPVADREGLQDIINHQSKSILKYSEEIISLKQQLAAVRPFVWTDELVEELIWDEYGDNAVRFKVDKFKQSKSEGRPAQP